MPPSGPADRRRFISRTLENANLAFEWASDQEPVAGLSVQRPDRPRLTLSVRHTGSVLQVIAHGALSDPFDVQKLADRDVLNQEWGLGRIYYVESSGAWDLSLGLHAPGRPAPAGALLAALASLSDAPALLSQGHPPALLVEPRRAPTEVMPAVQQALAAAGLVPRAEHAGEVIAVTLQLDRVQTRVEWFLAGGTLLIARARPLAAPAVPADAGVLRRLNALNGRLDIGAVGLWYEQGLPYGWIGHPIAWLDLTPETVRWTSERAGSWAEAALQAAR